MDFNPISIYRIRLALLSSVGGIIQLASSGGKREALHQEQEEKECLEALTLFRIEEELWKQSEEESTSEANGQGLVCECYSLSKQRLRSLIAENLLVGRNPRTGICAGSSCGRCLPLLAQILEDEESLCRVRKQRK